MNEKLKETIEKAKARKKEQDAIRSKEYQIIFETERRNEDERLALEMIKISAWVDENIYTHIENAIMHGDAQLSWGFLASWPANLDKNTNLEFLAKAINKVDGLKAQFEAAERMTDYPSFDHIYINWE